MAPHPTGWAPFFFFFGRPGGGGGCLGCVRPGRGAWSWGVAVGVVATRNRCPSDTWPGGVLSVHISRGPSRASPARCTRLRGIGVLRTPCRPAVGSPIGWGGAGVRSDTHLPPLGKGLLYPRGAGCGGGRGARSVRRTLFFRNRVHGAARRALRDVHGSVLQGRGCP